MRGEVPLHLLLTDAQLQSEAARLIKGHGLAGLPATGSSYSNAPIMFIVTPTTVNVCLPGGRQVGGCASNAFCAYHGDFALPNGGGYALYASVPFAPFATNPTKGCQTDGTSLYQSPAGSYHGDPGYNIADDLSHELSETITDPLLNAWYNDYNASEVGDLCEQYAATSNPSKDVSASAYAPTLGGDAASGTLFNQLINGDAYYNQTEWSNQAFGCMATPTT